MKKYVPLFEDFSLLQKLNSEYEKADKLSDKIKIGRELDQLKKSLGMKTSAEERIEREEEYKRKREEEQRFVDEQIDKFKKGLINIDIFGFGLYDSPLKPFKVKRPLYRGQSSWDNKNDNGGAAIFGNGLYSTSSRKYAASYGVVKVMDDDVAMPKDPLYFSDMNHFNQFEYRLALELFKDRNIKDKRYLYNDVARNIDFYLTRLGYDGVIIKSHDSHNVVVRYKKGE